MGKHRLEAIADGVYAIVMTLLVIELRLPDLGHVAGGATLGQALVDRAPRALAWLLSFWVLALFWIAHARLYRLLGSIGSPLPLVDLAQLALVSLLPFTSSLIGEHGDQPVAAALYSVHLLAIALLSWLRLHVVLRHPGWHGEALTPGLAAGLRRRVWLVNGCALVALALAFWVPGWNMLAMLGVAFAPVVGRARTGRP